MNMLPESGIASYCRRGKAGVKQNTALAIVILPRHRLPSSESFQALSKTPNFRCRPTRLHCLHQSRTPPPHSVLHSFDSEPFPCFRFCDCGQRFFVYLRHLVLGRESKDWGVTRAFLYNSTSPTERGQRRTRSTTTLSKRIDNLPRHIPRLPEAPQSWLATAKRRTRCSSASALRKPPKQA